MVGNHDPGLAMRLILPCSARNIAIFLGDLIAHSVDLIVLGIDSSDQGIVGDVFEMATVAKPRSSRSDMISRAFALGLDQDNTVLEVFTRPRVKWS